MDNGKGQTIFLSVIGIATLLVAIIGATFAWFSVTVQGNENANNITVNTAVLGNVVFEEGTGLDLGTNVQPNANPQITKTFTVFNNNEAATETIGYEIYLDVTTNTLTPSANGAFVYSLSGTTNGLGTVGMTVTEEDVPTSNTKIADGELVGYETHSYNFSVHFKETGENQNAAQGKAFLGKLRVELAANN